MRSFAWCLRRICTCRLMGDVPFIPYVCESTWLEEEQRCYVATRILVRIEAFVALAFRGLKKETGCSCACVMFSPCVLLFALMCSLSSLSLSLSLSSCTQPVFARDPFCFSFFCMFHFHAVPVRRHFQVSHIFSDKTGTLTCNIMDFRKFSVGEMSYGLVSSNQPSPAVATRLLQRKGAEG